MAKWCYLRMSFGTNFESIEIFPARVVNLDWVFTKYPKVKKTIIAGGTTLSIDPKSGEFLLGGKSDYITQVEEGILTYLGENGWKAYSFVPNWKTYAFKKKMDNE